MKKTPSSMRPHIGIFGRRNAGKSRLINAMTGQDLAIVSETPGTTTDPVGKAMEILPLGPVFIVDTAGLDDEGELGTKRIERSYRVLGHTDLIVLVSEPDRFGSIERAFIERMLAREEKMMVVFSKMDINEKNKESEEFLHIHKIPYIYTSSQTGENIRRLRYRLARMIPEVISSDIILRDLIGRNDIVIHVIPIDSAAPKGRIILPQEQALRDTLDAGGISVCIQTDELKETLNVLNRDPALVVTDSQAIGAVDFIVPKHIKVTTYSILFSRLKGDLVKFIEGLRVIDELQDNDEIIIAEACTHHTQADDIGRYKIPAWLEEFTGKKLKFTVNAGKMLHKDISNAKLIVQCGGCMVNRKEILSRIESAEKSDIPITNYGIIISHMHNALERTLAPFEEAGSIYRDIVR